MGVKIRNLSCHIFLYLKNYDTNNGHSRQIKKRYDAQNKIALQFYIHPYKYDYAYIR